MSIRKYCLLVCLAATLATSAFGGVVVSAPANGATVSGSVQFIATAASPACAKGVASVGIYTAPYVLAYVTSGTQLNTTLSLNPGTYKTVVQEWDNCGWSSSTPITITVGSGGGTGGGRTFSNLHAQKGWTGYALLPPGYGICNSCKSSGPQTTWSWTPGVKSPSQSGNATSTTIGGKTLFSDVLWNNHLIGDFSSQGLPDYNHTLIPTLHNFTYDVWFYVGNVEISQALEFDINQFFGGMSFIWGHECRVAGGHEWDTWNNQTQHWVPSGVACNPISNSWNHLVLQAERTSDNHLLFKSITLNGNTANINRTDSPTPTSWYGVTINYQIDGNYQQTPYAVVLDNLNFTVQ